MPENHRLHFLPSSTALRGTSRLFVLFAMLTAGCAPEQVYVYVQQEDGLGMKAPITVTVQIRVDEPNKVVTWMQDAQDSLGVKDRQIRTYGSYSGSVCQVFDAENWTCENRGADGTILEKPEMKNGVLSRFYWVQMQNYKRHYRLFDHTI